MTSHVDESGRSAAEDNDVSRLDEITRAVSARLVEVAGDGIDAAISEATKELALALEADRASFAELRKEPKGIVALGSWARETTPPATIDTIAGLDWFMQSVVSGRPVVLATVDDLPPDADAERAYMRRYGMQSNLSVPLRLGTGWHCFIACGTFSRTRRWSPLVVERVRFFGELLASAVLRCRQEVALARSHAEISRLNARLEVENAYLRDEITAEQGWGDIIGKSRALQRVLASVDAVASTDSTVLLTGETGTGKELIARAIHTRSRRRARPLVKVNCAALPASLVESELFGFERGAFTGADQTRPGRFEVAHSGTILLDEVGELPLETQPKLLRVLQEGQFERLGSSRTRDVDVRVIAATNRDLPAEVTGGRFRSDLFYRLNVFPVSVPPLRDRRDDIPLLVWHCIGRRFAKLRRRIDAVPDAVMARLQAYHWPGNVRELENVIERAMILSGDGALALDETLESLPSDGGSPSSMDLESVQRRHIQSVLTQCDWRIEGTGNAAERLGVNPSTLRFKLKKLGIERP
jgi:formate hydrogenlyase transcriptional activator